MRNFVTVALARYFGYEQPQRPFDPAALRRSIVEHAYQTVPYYRELLDANGIRPEGKWDLADFERIPLLDKPILRARADDLISTAVDRRKTFWNASGGSTGEPTRILQDQAYVRIMRGSIYAQKLFATGYRFGEPMIKLWGDEREVLVGTRSLKSKLASGLRGVTWMNSFLMTQERMEQYVATINRVRPRLIVAYARAMYELSLYVRQRGLEVSGVGGIITSAETLLPFMRESIEEAFGTHVYNRYGSREIGPVGIECSQRNGMHVAADVVHAEVVDDSGAPVPAGVEGDIIITSLANRAMPIIRYRIGDRGVMAGSPCACGVPGPVLASVTGRVMDSFRTRDGGVVSPVYFSHMIGVVLNSGRIRQFQMIQKDYEHVVLKIVAAAGDFQDDLRQIEHALKKALGEQCRIEVQQVAEIAPLPSGKNRFVVSEVPR